MIPAVKTPLVFIPGFILLLLFNSSNCAAQLVQQGPKLYGGPIISKPLFGEDVALSANGNRAVINGQSDSNGRGAIWVFERTAGSWSQSGPKIIGTGFVSANSQRPLFATSVDISGDGNTIVTGIEYDSGYYGALAVFIKSATGWLRQGGRLTGINNIDGASLGWAVAASSDGNTIIGGGPRDNTWTGAAWIFTRTDTNWSQGVKLTGSGTIGRANFGISVSISGDGNTAVVGGSDDSSYTGAVWTFVRTGNTWQQAGNKLKVTNAIGASRFGQKVAISADGNTLVASGPEDNGWIGATWVFTRQGNGWVQQAKLVGSGFIGQTQQGISVSVSADGNTVATGGWFDNHNAGAAWLFRRTGTAWQQVGSKITPNDFVGEAQMGYATDLSADGQTLLAGGDGDRNKAGAAWVFINNGTSWQQQGPRLQPNDAITTRLYQGRSVSLSADGNMLAESGPGLWQFEGAGWIFTRSGTTWTQQVKLQEQDTVYPNIGNRISLSADGNTAVMSAVYSGDTAKAYVFYRTGGVWSSGFSVISFTPPYSSSSNVAIASISADGNTIIIGLPYYNGDEGGVWIYARSGNNWIEQANRLLPSNPYGVTPWFGRSVALSGDGSIALVGASNDGGGVGAAWIYKRTGNSWQMVSTLRPSSSPVAVGTAVAISTDGTTCVIGGPAFNSNRGAAWIYTFNGSYAQLQGSAFTAADTVGAAGFGSSVAISADGTSVLIGAPNDNNYKGAIWLYKKTGNVWQQQGNKITGTTSSPTPGFGTSVALSSDGTTAAAGGMNDDQGRGAVWIFTANSTTCNTNTWLGTVSSAWENPSNWSCGTVPGANTNVIINSGTVVLNSTTTIYTFTVAPGVNFTINSGNTLTVIR